MAIDKLYAIIEFVDVAPGETATLPHGLVLRGDPVQPDIVLPQNPAFSVVSADTVNLTIRNGGSTASSNFWVQAIHPATRLLGLAPDDGLMTQGMTPRPFAPDSGVPTPPFEPAVTTIYARTTGSDTTGTGTLLNPFRTFQRGIRDVPSPATAPGNRYIVDITGIGTEILPQNYQFPVIQSAAIRYSYFATAEFPYYFAANSVTIRAAPELFGSIPPADAVITAADNATVSSDPDTNLITVTIAAPRASWAADALRDRHVIRTALGFRLATCCIAGSDATHLFLCNDATRFNGGNGALVLAPGEQLQIVVPSATLEAPAPTASPLGAQAITCANVSSINFQGIRFRCTDTSQQALFISRTPNPFFELCVIEGGMDAEEVLTQVSLHSVTLAGGDIVAEDASFTIFSSSIHDVTGWFLTGLQHVFQDSVMRDSATLTADTFIGPRPSPTWAFQNLHLVDSTGDAVRCQEGIFDFNHVSIDGAAGHAIRAEQGNNYLKLTRTVGSGNTGFGISATDGAFVQIRDTDTNVTGTAGDMKSGSQAARTWVDFYGTAPVGNEWDLITPFIADSNGVLKPQGNDSGAPCTGTRIFQRTP